MFLVALLCIFFATASAESCHDRIENLCSTTFLNKTTGAKPLDAFTDCTAKYGHFKNIINPKNGQKNPSNSLKNSALSGDNLLTSVGNPPTSLQKFANANIETSFKYLLMSAYFGNYEANREGFKGLYRKYSDKLWKDAISVIKYITKRGGMMNFNEMPISKVSKYPGGFNEITSLAMALDMHKELAESALNIHAESHMHMKDKSDAAVAHFIEEEFFEAHTDTVRDLAGYTNDLQKLLTERDASVSVFLFDEFLKKSL